MSRPELTGHASLFYNEKEARKYDSSSRMIGVQREITDRAIELLRLDPAQPALVLDIGCGSGLSGQVLEEAGHVWIGCDISRDMLTVAKERMDRQQASSSSNSDAAMQDDDSNSDDDDDDDDENATSSTGDLIHQDMGTGLPFRPATFDACVSVSALQWLCYSNSNKQVPKRRLTRFFASLYQVLRRGGRAVLQFYPETAEQAVLISETATRVGFTGGVVVDYPNSAKAKKHYLVLSFDRGASGQQQKKKAAMAARSTVGGQQKQQHVVVQHDNNSAVAVGAGRHNANATKKQPPRKKRGGIKTKEWILHKKESQRRKGKSVREDTKYTARRRPRKF